MSEPTSSLETTYRRTLLAYPASWRKQNEGEMVGVMLDLADQEQRTKPTVGELANLVGSGLATRCERLLGWVPASGRDRIACFSLIIASSLATIMLVLGELGRWFRFNSYPPGPGLFGPFTTPASLTYLLILGAFMAASLGWHAARRILLGLAILTAVSIPLISSAIGGVVTVGWPVSAVFVGASVLSLPGDPTNTVRQHRALVLGAPLAAVAFGFSSYMQGGGAQKWFYPGGVGMGADFLAFAAGCLLVSGLLTFGVPGRWKPAAVLLAIGTLTLPIKVLFMALIPNNAWPTLTAVCITAAIFIAWQVRQAQTRS
ncbi:hypothetical protein [Arthrobacter glacialis]|uniref:Uncharacterized protein n=1 Tax=Arthrobacter glacialis TaxID=1664 RepID=A0A2S3ZRD0_ARTGL|nr:hypothetical protein [Arthrobacter glacialis]POH71664.1 hypothetical protein CVS27_19955 [Arthrobacter glacialis]